MRTCLRTSGARILKVFFLVAAVLVVDILTKLWMYQVGMGSCNSGVSFGFWVGVPLFVWLIGSGVMLTMLLFMLFRLKVNGLVRFGIGLVVAGGVSNLVTRLIWGCIWDWIVIEFAGIECNAADIIIDTGVGFVLVGLISWMIEQRNQKRQGDVRTNLD